MDKDYKVDNNISITKCDQVVKRLYSTQIWGHKDLKLLLLGKDVPAKGKEYKIKLVQSPKQNINIQYWSNEEITALLNGDEVGQYL